MYKIYLDDIRTPYDESWIVVRTYKEFIDKIRLIGLDKIDIISLDHDLADYVDDCKKEYTGYDCAKFLVQTSIDENIMMPYIQVHSANPIGGKNIISYINNFLKHNKLPKTCDFGFIPHHVE